MSLFQTIAAKGHKEIEVERLSWAFGILLRLDGSRTTVTLEQDEPGYQMKVIFCLNIHTNTIPFYTFVVQLHFE